MLSGSKGVQPPRNVTVTCKYEPDMGSQVEAILYLLGYTGPGRFVDGHGEGCIDASDRPDPNGTKGGREPKNQRRRGRAVSMEEPHDDSTQEISPSSTMD